VLRRKSIILLTIISSIFLIPIIQAEAASILNIEIKKNGPILITTDCTITHGDGSKETKQGTTALCRCGQSANKPYCDGTHRKVGFETER